MNSQEIKDFVIAWIALSVSFTILDVKRNFALLGLKEILFALIVSAIAVGTGFVLHEMAHRQVARKFGYYSEFRAWPMGLVLALILPIFTGFIFAAPGATYIYGENISRKENGIISIAGPLTNIGLAIIFFTITLFNALFIQTAWLYSILLTATFVNLGLAFFNMIPIPPLDGSKVIIWNPIIWGIIFFPLFGLVFLF